MKYSKVLIIAVCILSVVASAYGDAAPSSTCDATTYKDAAGNCKPIPNLSKKDATSHLLNGCVANAKPQTGTDYSKCVCDNTFVEKPNLCEKATQPVCQGIGQKFENNACVKCPAGQKVKAADNTCVDDPEEKCNAMHRVWVVGNAEADRCTKACLAGFHFIKDGDKYLSEYCFATVAETACPKDKHRVVLDNNSNKFCVCAKGYEPAKLEEYSGTAECKSGASMIAISSAAVLTFIGTVAYLL